MPNRYFTDDGWKQFCLICKRRGKPTNQAIADYLRLHVRTIQRWESKENGLNNETLILLQEKFGLSHDQLNFFTSPSPDEKNKMPRDPNLSSPVSLLKEPRHDLKNVIFKPEIISRLLNDEKPPSLLECVCASRNHTPPTPEHKNRALENDTDFNLFFQVSALLQVILPVSRHVITIGAVRRNVHGTQKYQHTDGWSILFSASFPFNVKPTDYMDQWVAGIEINSASASWLIKEPNPLLLHILRYKLDLVGFRVSIQPFAMLLRDERIEGRKNAYCQYCFLIVIDWTGVTSVEEMDIYMQIRKQLSSSELDLDYIRETHEPKTIFRSSSGKPNTMDILAWRKLQGEQGTLFEGTSNSSKLIPHFDLIPKV